MKRLYKRDNIMLEILNGELLETVCFNLTASSLSKKENLPVHLKKYAPILAKCSYQKFMTNEIIDWGTIYTDQEWLPASVELEDKILQILIIT
ncbi:hypothetical protein BGZ91_006499 [Linnemannia elongata]|nr:hypothetical protein BGZ91_006499 [Linnemannia elongata]